MKHKSSIFLEVLLVLSVITVLGACSNKVTNQKNLKKVYVEGSFSINVDSPRATVGDADYVFVGRVIQKDKTSYKDTVTVETANGGAKEVSTPYSNYKVSVLKNIKGNLKVDSSIPIQKFGGVNKDHTEIVLYEDDQLPEENKTYVFLAYAQDDGSLLISGPNSNKIIGDNSNEATAKNISLYAKKSDVISDYQNAYEHQIETKRDRSISKYDTMKND
ncbi:hypothetical protein [Sporolactobacillus terrae]|uniref:Cell surface protein n=2 Tax=Sporolactobacillus terrae TaxID=269673 RepID=A0A5K7X4G1_9BACL|nr:hypothetical protein [Sporolactobacillus terrae]UAK17215.1 hypothetical protein K7399_04545 [Sporolactobacillus terrae]BBN98746.1 cell surface protein [Sporolactobacillus terrae]